ncbi:MmcB family DNA repair protein [Pseudohoeflea coraliihabitans]|uniref:MmcB family DNA repair protein n=1 Tax=Pseudohoeflea coraliihabitans TaxID=2860393 RepID=A0ABS6WSZ7_9HYPH|nr:MmcB family DNA repair protein [Pseudohoeflea sp. DP4N28-3]MBW3099086.1 MmcB family DNA repair protein [Pseudohoeflea sp. DP4N28-3]
MPIISPHKSSPLLDGRQSDRAMLVRRGIQRLFLSMRISLLPEMTLASGRRADLIALTDKGDIWIVEIKTSVADLRTDGKWPDYRDYCDRLYFATHAGVPPEIFPQDCGLLIADSYGADWLREAPEHRLAPARRKVLTRQFARLAADRLVLAEFAASGNPE